MKQNKPVFHKDFRDFIELCNKHGLRYVVVGGFAVGFHGYPRGTKDIDVCVEANEENARKVEVVLDEFGMKSLGLTQKDFLAKGSFAQFGYDPVRIDIMTEIEEVPFDEIWENKNTVQYEGLPIHFVGFEQLLKMKAVAARPQDLADIAKLKARNKNKL